ncbi:hypothetical protein [Lutibacter sp.]|uniref:hypothetical protein n=1 Tax=Lutibacter sp. TaxID=1925666 RepID=UPI002736AFC6|nr:hypothetical protein [Lutibacter sp.]MDP3314277.1 hypothetical protein [Lutibacter sp.]
MHKKLEADLVSLAHSILQMKNREDVLTLHKKAHEIYEKLSILKFVEDYINSTPTATETKEELVQKFEMKVAIDEKILEDATSEKEEIVEEKITLGEIIEDSFDALFSLEDEIIKDDPSDLFSLQSSLENEFKDAISADEATLFFENASKIEIIYEDEIEVKKEMKKLSLNDTLFKNNIQVGLNDRIAFVKYLFNGSQEDFNRVLSQLNSFKTEQESKHFISYIVKPDYNWSNQSEYEQRLIELVERKFL